MYLGVLSAGDPCLRNCVNCVFVCFCIVYCMFECVFVFVAYLGVVSFYHSRENNTLSIGCVRVGATTR